jgi:hypothetical protein
MFELESRLPALTEALQEESAPLAETTDVGLYREFLMRLRSIGFPSHHSLSIPLQELVMIFTHNLAGYSLHADPTSFPTDKAQALQAAVDYVNNIDSMKYPLIDVCNKLSAASTSIFTYCCTTSELLMLRGYVQRLLRTRLILTGRERMDESDADLARTTEVKMRQLGMKIARVTSECQLLQFRMSESALDNTQSRLYEGRT